MEDLSTISADWLPGTVFLTRTTDTNHSGWLFAVTILCLLYTVTLLLVTSATRRKWTPSDWAFLAASLCALTSHAVVLAGLPHGLGKASDSSLESRSRSSVQDVCLHALSTACQYCTDRSQFGRAYTCLYFLADGGAKLSTALALYRLFEPRALGPRILAWCSVIFATLPIALSLLILNINCSQPFAAVADSALCPLQVSRLTLTRQYLSPWFMLICFVPQTNRWTGIIAMDIGAEFTIVLCALCLVYPIQISQRRKIVVVIVFAARVVCIPFSILVLHMIRRMAGGLDEWMTLTSVIMITEAKVFLALATTCLPRLRLMIRPADQMDVSGLSTKNNTLVVTRRISFNVEEDQQALCLHEAVSWKR